MHSPNTIEERPLAACARVRAGAELQDGAKAGPLGNLDQQRFRADRVDLPGRTQREEDRRLAAREKALELRRQRFARRGRWRGPMAAEAVRGTDARVGPKASAARE